MFYKHHSSYSLKRVNFILYMYEMYTVNSFDFQDISVVCL